MYWSTGFLAKWQTYEDIFKSWCVIYILKKKITKLEFFIGDSIRKIEQNYLLNWEIEITLENHELLVELKQLNKWYI